MPHPTTFDGKTKRYNRLCATIARYGRRRPTTSELLARLDDVPPHDPHFAPTGVYHSWEYWRVAA
jgi:hypothetical protein